MEIFGETGIYSEKFGDLFPENFCPVEKLRENRENLDKLVGDSLRTLIQSSLHFYIFKMTLGLFECRAWFRGSRSRKWSAHCMWCANSWRFAQCQDTTSIYISYSWCQTNQLGRHSPCCCIRFWIACTAPADYMGWRKLMRAYAD